MALNNILLGELIEPVERYNSELKYGVDDVRGVSNTKVMIETHADMSSRTFEKFYIVAPNEFVFNRRTTRNGERLGLAFNDTNREYIFTNDYVAFKVKEDFKNRLDATYLYMFFLRDEFDRYVRYCSWGSATEFFNWEEMQAVHIALPDIEIQRKYVAIYRAMQKNQRSYEKGLDDLRLACEAYIEELRKKTELKQLGDYISLSNEKNESMEYDISSVRGVSIEKKFIETKADMKNVSLKNYNVIPPDAFAYVTVTSRNGEKISLAINDSEETYICSGTYPVFYSTDKDVLDPHYLSLILCRDEFNRYARFHSWGSARETFDWDELCKVQIPLPDIKLQRAITSLFAVYNKRREINERLKNNLKRICPILIHGAVTEAMANS